MLQEEEMIDKEEIIRKETKKANVLEIVKFYPWRG